MNPKNHLLLKLILIEFIMFSSFKYGKSQVLVSSNIFNPNYVITSSTNKKSSVLSNALSHSLNINFGYLYKSKIGANVSYLRNNIFSDIGLLNNLVSIGLFTVTKSRYQLFDDLLISLDYSIYSKPEHPYVDITKCKITGIGLVKLLNINGGLYFNISSKYHFGKIYYGDNIGKQFIYDYSNIYLGLGITYKFKNK
jgi:hypothetical protein